MLVCVGLLVWGSRILRAGELAITGGVMSLVVGRTVVYPPGHYVFFETAASRTVALQVTASCSAIFLLLPFLLLTALMISIPRVRTARLLSAAVVGTMIVFWFNQLRLLIIAWATHQWGIGTGFDWAHILAGSAVTTMSMLIALICSSDYPSASLAPAPERLEHRPHDSGPCYYPCPPGRKGATPRMYGTGGTTIIGGGVAGVGALATTGTASVLFAVIGLLLIVVGLLMVRAVAVRAPRS